MSVTKFAFHGGRELEKALAQLDKAATRKSTSTRALKKAAAPIAAKAEALAPARTKGSDQRKLKSGKTITRPKGSLKSHINVGTRLSKRQASQNRKLGKAEVEVYVGTRDRVGRLAEFGNVNAGAQPFMRPAWDSEGNETALRRIGDEMWDDIKRTAARQAKRRK